MRRHALLLVAAVVIGAVALLGAILAPGALAEPREPQEPPGRVGIEEVTVSTGTVTGDSATLVVDTYLTHQGGPAENVSLALRTIDAETGFQTTTQRIDLGTVETGGEVVATSNLTVERSGGYRLEVLLYEDGRRTQRGTKEIRGLDALTPSYAQTDVQFHRFEGREIPAVEFSVADVSDNRTTLDVSTYLTNQGSATGGLELVVLARQADSNIVADRSAIQVGQLGAGETVTPETQLTVPSGYNYYLDAILWKDGVIVGTTRAAANLDPQRTISVNETTEDVGLEVSDFERDEGPGVTPTPEMTTTETTQPGFGIGVAVAALLGGALLLRRRSA